MAVHIRKNKIEKSFWIDRFEVSQKEYSELMEKTPSYFKGENLPVEKVTWYDAKKYCERLGKRLPEKWEWEKAIRSETISPFYWMDGSPDLYAWSKGNANKKTHAVG